MARASSLQDPGKISCNALSSNGTTLWDENKPGSDVLTAHSQLMKLQSQRRFFHTRLLSNAYFWQQMLYVFAYPVGDYLHLSVLIQVYFQICNSSALGSERICKKIRKEKLFCFQLISLHILEQKKENKAIQKGVSSQPAVSNAIILIDIEKKIIHSLFSSKSNHTLFV